MFAAKATNSINSKRSKDQWTIEIQVTVNKLRANQLSACTYIDTSTEIMEWLDLLIFGTL